MIPREQLVEDLRHLSEEDIQRVMKYISILKSKLYSGKTKSLNEESLRIMYAEAYNEDSMLADSGLADYSAGLKREDNQ